MTSALSLQGLTLDSLPTSANSPVYQPLISSLVSSASALLASLEQPSSWQPHKTYHSSTTPTTTLSSASPPGPAPLPSKALKWHERTSVHQHASFDEFKLGLLQDHSRHEHEYVESCTKAERLQVIEEGVLEVWRTAYHLPFPTTNRDFTFLLLTLPLSPSHPSLGLPPSPPLTPESITSAPTPPLSAQETAPRSFIVISVPVDLPSRPGWVRAKYVSVESVVERPEGGVVWRMATASQVNGRIPDWIAERAMPSKIAEDVPSFLGWLEKRRKSAGDVELTGEGEEEGGGKGGERRGSAP